jgi:hypothetical protein
MGGSLLKFCIFSPMMQKTPLVERTSQRENAPATFTTSAKRYEDLEREKKERCV